MAKLLSPSISITFVEKAASMIERGSRGIVALVLRDASIKGEPEVYTIRDVTGIPAGWSEANKQYVNGLLEGVQHCAAESDCLRDVGNGRGRAAVYGYAELSGDRNLPVACDSDG